jgi:site-specific DNA-methyltransferase (cytosine-N4-specific)
MTHGFHMYPARMMPLVARRLIQRYATNRNDIIFEPFVGSGGVLVEARLQNRDSIGVDINPLAVLIAKAKSTPIDPRTLENQASKLLELCSKDVKDGVGRGYPNIKNVGFWFTRRTIEHLMIIKHHLDSLRAKENLYNFFACAFSYTVRKTSNVRVGEFKLYRLPEKDLQAYEARTDVLRTFRQIVTKNIQGMSEFYDAVKGTEARTYVFVGDTRRLFEINPERLHEESASLVVTSPPYGDAHTTVAYGQFSRYPALWLGLNPATVMELDKKGLGGRKRVGADVDKLDSPTLYDVYEKVKKRDPSRASELYSFFYDIDVCMSNIGKVLRKGRSHCCFVLGNRTVRRVRIPADHILIEIARKHGFEHLETRYREIPNKHVPLRNAPENIAGMNLDTISKESIIIWKV